MSTDDTETTVADLKAELSGELEEPIDALPGWLALPHGLPEHEHRNGTKQHLVLLLTALRGEASGKQLIDDSETLTGSRWSPNTVYTRLHELEDDGVLGLRELSRTKQYAVADEERVRERLQGAMRQHLHLASLFHAGLEELED